MGLKEKCTEEKILEAAKNVFMKYGFYGAKMQDISNQAGINKTSCSFRSLISPLELRIPSF